MPYLKKHLIQSKGYAMVLNADSDGGELVNRLAQHTGMQVIGLVKTPQSADQLRRAFASKNLYGTRVSIQTLTGQLPYRARCFNLVTSPKAFSGLTSSRVKSLLRPLTGIIWVPGKKDPLYTAPELKGAGEWTHMYADPGNSACSGDTLVGSSLALQWFGRPGPQHIIDRHLRPPPPLVKNGILVTPGNNYVLTVDAWNGTILWEKPIANMRRIGALRDSGNMVLTDDLLYCASGSECLALDVYTGEEKHRFSLPTSVSPDTHEWGYLASVGSGVIGSSVKKGTVRREMSYTTIYSTAYTDTTTIAYSDAIFAMDRHDGKLHWTYKAKGGICNPSIAVSDNKVFFIESRNLESLQKTTYRMDYPEFIGKTGGDMVCLDLRNGKELWREPLKAPAEIETLFLLAKGKSIVLCTARNHKAKGAGSVTVHYDIRCYQSTNGRLEWEQTRDHKKRPNGEHGEQDHHPAIVGDRIIAEPYIYNIKTGKEVGRFDRAGYGCGTISASARSLYFRAGNIATFDLEKSEKNTITSVNRTGCWINMIPASGLLLVPEGSSGCICGYPVQGSMGFAPSSNAKK